MKLKRRREPEIAPANLDENSLVIATVFVTLDESMERYADLNARREAGESADELRPEALETARKIGLVIRASWEGMLNSGLLGDSLPAHLSPDGALRVLARLGYALVALAEPDPLPDTLLSPAELDGLFAKHEIEDWVRWFRELRPRLEAEGT
ncbi:MAG: hypothetical protein M3071_02495 [Actinomycetota bacterium]|nr:hypothetical protein [Actinomycetota bacterium]